VATCPTKPCVTGGLRCALSPPYELLMDYALRANPSYNDYSAAIGWIPACAGMTNCSSRISFHPDSGNPPPPALLSRPFQGAALHQPRISILDIKPWAMSYPRLLVPSVLILPPCNPCFFPCYPWFNPPPLSPHPGHPVHPARPDSDFPPSSGTYLN